MAITGATNFKIFQPPFLSRRSWDDSAAAQFVGATPGLAATESGPLEPFESSEEKETGRDGLGAAGYN